MKELEQKQILYTVKDLRESTGVSRKTLFYYDKNDLLKPLFREGSQNHKIYSQDGYDKLIEIMAYRKAGLSIHEIKEIFAKPHLRQQIFQKAMQRLQKELSNKQEEIDHLNQFMQEK